MNVKSNIRLLRREKALELCDCVMCMNENRQPEIHVFKDCTYYYLIDQAIDAGYVFMYYERCEKAIQSKGLFISKDRKEWKCASCLFGQCHPGLNY